MADDPKEPPGFIPASRDSVVEVQLSQPTVQVSSLKVQRVPHHNSDLCLVIMGKFSLPPGEVGDRIPTDPSKVPYYYVLSTREAKRLSTKLLRTVEECHREEAKKDRTRPVVPGCP